MSAGDLCRPSGPEGEGQARGQARSAHGEPSKSGSCRLGGEVVAQQHFFGHASGVTEEIEPSYRALTREAGISGLGHSAVTERLIDCVRQSLRLLAKLPQVGLTSHVAGKEYFFFKKTTSTKTRTSRGINRALFIADIDEVVDTLSHVISRDIPADPIELHQALYTAAISFPAANDVTKDRDQKSPGTFFENFVGHLAASTFGVRPTTTVIAPTLDLEISLPTDLIFDLGPGKSRIHLPVKISTRERVIQVWAHQRVLDGMHGVNRFRGLLVALAETNRQMATNSISEVCLPNQWTAYQMYIAQLHRVYYLDVPGPYRNLRDHYPFLQVRPFADFFYECDQIALPTVTADTIEASKSSHGQKFSEPRDI